MGLELCCANPSPCCPTYTCLHPSTPTYPPPPPPRHVTWVGRALYRVHTEPNLYQGWGTSGDKEGPTGLLMANKYHKVECTIIE